jgi:hypothetical protein
MKVIPILMGIIIAFMIFGWAGLRIKPSPFSGIPQQQPVLEYVSLPAGRQAPVERFYRLVYGENIPLIKTAVVSGRGTMRFLGLYVPIRFRFTHEAGQNYRQDIHLTFFGLPWMKAFETYIDGHGWANTPGMHEGEGFDQGSNVSLWAEALNWFPSILVTDPRVQWKPVDEATALLVVPLGSAKEVFVIRFDPNSGGVQNIEAMKYKASIDKKVLWNNGIWFDEGQPWIYFDVESVLYNVDVWDTIRAQRP